MRSPTRLRLNLRRMAIATVSAFGLLASPALAETYYVDKKSVGGGCDDARPAEQARSAGAPWCSPARALAAAPEGATVLMRAGTYSNVRAVGVARSQMLTFKAASGEAVTLVDANPGDNDVSTRALSLEGSRNLRWEGLKIVGGTYVRDSSFVVFADNEITTTGLRLRNVADALVEGNDFHDFTAGARALEATANTGEPGVKRLTIRGNELHRIEHDAISLYWRLENVVIEDNYIHALQRPAGSDLHPDAIQIAPQSEGGWGSIIVRRNRILDYDQGLLIKDGITRGVVVENNVLGPPRIFAAHIYDTPGAKFLNNTVAGGNFYLRRGATGVTALNNVFDKFAIDPTASVALANFNMVDRSQYNPGYVPASKDVNGKATFVDPAGGDHRLAAGSLGIDSGTSDQTPGRDLEGLSRVDDPATSNTGGGLQPFFDMGAHEFTGSAGPPPPSDPPPTDPPPTDPPTDPPPTDPPPADPPPTDPPHTQPAPTAPGHGEPAPTEAHRRSPGEAARPRAASPILEPAKLEVARSDVLDDGGSLDVLAPITKRASGTVDVDFHAAGRHTRLAAQIDSQQGYVRFRKDLPREQVRSGTGILTLTYPGNDRTRGQEVRLRAASGRARLDLDRPTLNDGRVGAGGTISDRARGVVRVQLNWATGGQDRSLELQARIRDGRWSVDEALPSAVAQDIARRDGTVHTYTLFTGYLPASIRGEMRSYQVLGAP